MDESEQGHSGSNIREAGGYTNGVTNERAKRMNSSEKLGGKGRRKGRIHDFWLIKKFGCLRVESDEVGNVDMSVRFPGERENPTHLLVMVNGLIGSAQDWRYAAQQFLKMYPRDLVVHCSERNHSTHTFDGVDVMGNRLAEEVRSVIKRHPSVQKISFVGHSLGGLIARYAVAILYQQEKNDMHNETLGDCSSDSFRSLQKEVGGKIAGLQPINFITSATPHLGSRGHKQAPLLCGFYPIEKIAPALSWCLGRTGRHLLLTDNTDGKPPLLLRMVKDDAELKFMSALQCFKRRVAYANVCFDKLVGWSTSSIRRLNELPKLNRSAVDERYPHVKNVEADVNVSCESVNATKKGDFEEEMVRALTQQKWDRVDVRFRGSLQRLFAHSTIQVKTYWLNKAGADVIQHMVDNFVL